MQFRHEVKCEITKNDMIILHQRLRVVMKSDPHAQNGIYEIRSLYFDNPKDKALREKIDGINIREKYRIRLYNKDTSVIRLERKYKHNHLGFKETAFLTEDETKAILKNDISRMAESKNDVILSFYTKIKNEALAPKVIVDYTREPFVFNAGNVRVTLDYNIRTALKNTDLLNFDCVTVPAKESPCILEVKWDNFLPDVIRNALWLDFRQTRAFSKYAACRMYE